MFPSTLRRPSKIDGCTEFKAFWRVVFPLLGPCTASLVVLNGLSIWNDFLMPYLALPSNQAKTITVAVYSFVGQYTARWDIVFCRYADLPCACADHLCQPAEIFCQGHHVRRREGLIFIP